jgi:small subunit ribosomal protein S9
MAEVTEQTQVVEEQPAEQQPPTQAQPLPVLTTPGGMKQYYGTGRRKTGVARVYLRPGNGQIVVNGRPLENYFPTESIRISIRQPLDAAEAAKKFNVTVTVRGGGPRGQADAIRLGIARALLEYDLDLRKKLKKLGFLTRDARIHERKKYGQKGARKRFQFSKR